MIPEATRHGSLGHLVHHPEDWYNGILRHIFSVEVIGHLLRFPAPWQKSPKVPKASHPWYFSISPLRRSDPNTGRHCTCMLSSSDSAIPLLCNITVAGIVQSHFSCRSKMIPREGSLVPAGLFHGFCSGSFDIKVKHKHAFVDLVLGRATCATENHRRVSPST